MSIIVNASATKCSIFVMDLATSTVTEETNDFSPLTEIARNNTAPSQECLQDKQHHRVSLMPSALEICWEIRCKLLLVLVCGLLESDELFLILLRVHLRPAVMTFQ